MSSPGVKRSLTRIATTVLAVAGLAAAHFLAIGPALAQGGAETVAREYQRLAEQGDASAQAQLGYLYYVGEGVPQSYVEAVKWYQKAAVQGNRDAQYNLAVAYAFGEGITQDYKEAALWYRRAAEQGHTPAQYSLGISYSYGEGVSQDPKEAARWFRMAAEQGYVRAQVMIGSKYHTGDGVALDYDEAVKWYRLAADRGDAAAQYNLGSMYRSGKGVEQDYNQAMRWFRLAADQGYAAAQNELTSLERAVGGAARARGGMEAPQAETATAPREELFSVDRSRLLSIEQETAPQQTAAAGSTEDSTSAAEAAPVSTAPPAEGKTELPAEAATPAEGTAAAETKPKRGVLGFLGRLFKSEKETGEQPVVEGAPETPQAYPVEGSADATPDLASTQTTGADTELLAMDDVQPALPEGAVPVQTAMASEAATPGPIPDQAVAPAEVQGPSTSDLEEAAPVTDEAAAADEQRTGVSRFLGRLFGRKKEAAPESPPESAAAPEPGEVTDIEASVAGTGAGMQDLSGAIPPAPEDEEQLAELESALDAAAAPGPEEIPPGSAVPRAAELPGTESPAVPLELPGEEPVDSGAAAEASMEAEPEQDVAAGEAEVETAPEPARGFFSRLFGRSSTGTPEEAEAVAAADAEPGSDPGTGESEDTQGEYLEPAMDAEPAADEETGAAEQKRRRGFFGRLFGRADDSAAEDRDQAEAAPGADAVAMAEPAPAHDLPALTEPHLSDPAALEAAMEMLVRGEYDAAYDAFRELGSRGDPRAQFQVGSLYYQGLGVEQDYDSAALWYRRAAEQGHAEAQYSLGNMFLMGEGVEQHDAAAGHWYEKAAAAGHPAARHNLENLQRMKTMAASPQPAVAEGEQQPAAQATVISEEGAGRVEEEQPEKRGFLSRLFGRKSSAPEDSGAPATAPRVETPEAAVPAAPASVEDEAAPAETEEAGVETPAAEKSKVGGFFGRIFGRGMEESADAGGAEETASPDTATSAETKQAIAPVTDADAASDTYQKGIAYSLGDGVPRDPAEAFKWFLAAAELGHAPAQYKAGVAYAYGEGTGKDPEQAAAWYRRAAAQGYAIAQRNLGIMYLNGDGVDENKPMALAWYTILADGGNVMDVRRRDSLARELSSPELAEARLIMERLRAEMSAAR